MCVSHVFTPEKVEGFQVSTALGKCRQTHIRNIPQEIEVGNLQFSASKCDGDETHVRNVDATTDVDREELRTFFREHDNTRVGDICTVAKVNCLKQGALLS